MSDLLLLGLDLMPPPFAEGLADWSRGDGTPASPSYETGEAARIARNDPDFGTCLELRKVDAVQRLRYMGELPIRPGVRVEVRARIKALRGPLPTARIAAWPGGFGARAVADLPGAGPVAALAHGVVTELRAVIGRAPGDGVDLVWDARALYAHVGLDLLGPAGGIVRVADIAVRELAGGTGAAARTLPGFESRFESRSDSGAGFESGRVRAASDRGCDLDRPNGPARRTL